MLAVLAIALSAIFAFLASVHVYWAFGGRFAKVAAIPELCGTPSFVPGRMATLLVAGGLFACAARIGAAGGFIDVPVQTIVIRWGCFLLALALGVFLVAWNLLCEERARVLTGCAAFPRRPAFVFPLG